MKAKYSVITAVYNRHDCINACMESVSSQACDVPFEHIVVDDGSSDRTPALAKEYAATHASTTFIALDHNQGPNAARNAAVRAASGDFIIILDSDDVMRPGAMKVIADTVEAHPECGHYLFAVSDREDELKARGFVKDGEYEFSFDDILFNRQPGDFVHVINRVAMLEMPFMEQLRIHEGAFILRYLKRAHRIMFKNTIVFDRDRSRDDRVSFETIPARREHLERHLKSISLRLEWFGSDYMREPDGINRINHLYIQKFKYHVLLGEYDEASRAYGTIRSNGGKPGRIPSMLWRLRLGRPAFMAAKIYYHIKQKAGIRPE